MTIPSEDSKDPPAGTDRRRHDPDLIPVAIVGAGPVGLSLALGLSRLGIRSVLLERKDSTSERSKAPGIHIRTREVLRQWGVEDRFLEAGELLGRVTLHSSAEGRRPLLSVDFGALEAEASRPGLLVLEQGETERLLLESVREPGLCDIRFGAEAVGIEVRERAAAVVYRQGGAEEAIEARYVVGADGAGSFVRDALGLSFEGLTYSIRPMLADVRIQDERDRLPWPRVRNTPGGFTFALRLRSGLWRIVRLERGDPEAGEEVPDNELREHVSLVLGEGTHETVWANRFRIHRRSAPRFRDGSVLLAGDAAHVHSPAGGLGMNAGIQDAHNLAWKLAAALESGPAEADRLLDSYDEERRAVVVGSVSRYADLVTRTFLQAPTAVRAGAFGVLRLAVRVPPLRRRLARRASMLDLGYRSSPLLESGAPAAGGRLPDVPLDGPDGAQTRLHDLLPYGPALILVDGNPGAPDGQSGGGLGRATTVAREAHASGAPWLETVIRIGPGGWADSTGTVERLVPDGAGWLLVRPDAHVARAGSPDESVRDAAEHALGVRTAAR